MERQAKAAIQNHVQRNEKTNGPLEDDEHLLFSTILKSPEMIPEEKVYNRISQEGAVVIGAGGETTSRILTTATFFVFSNRETLLQSLQDEIRTIIPNRHARPSFKKLEGLPLLVRTWTPPSITLVEIFH